MKDDHTESDSKISMMGFWNCGEGDDGMFGLRLGLGLCLTVFPTGLDWTGLVII